MVISTQPPGFVDPALPDHVCLLQKSLYGLKQAPLFVYKDGASIAYLLLYVDDIVLTASSCALLHNIIGRLHTEFAMTDLGALHHFFGISVTCSLDGLSSNALVWVSATLQQRPWIPKPSYQPQMEHRWLILLNTKVWLAPFSISL